MLLRRCDGGRRRHGGLTIAPVIARRQADVVLTARHQARHLVRKDVRRHRGRRIVRWGLSWQATRAEQVADAVHVVVSVPHALVEGPNRVHDVVRVNRHLRDVTDVAEERDVPRVALQLSLVQAVDLADRVEVLNDAHECVARDVVVQVLTPHTAVERKAEETARDLAANTVVPEVNDLDLRLTLWPYTAHGLGVDHVRRGAVAVTGAATQRDGHQARTVHHHRRHVALVLVGHERDTPRVPDCSLIAARHPDVAVRLRATRGFVHAHELVPEVVGVNIVRHGSRRMAIDNDHERRAAIKVSAALAVRDTDDLHLVNTACRPPLDLVVDDRVAAVVRWQVPRHVGRGDRRGELRKRRDHRVAGGIGRALGHCRRGHGHQPRAGACSRRHAHAQEVRRACREAAQVVQPRAAVSETTQERGVRGHDHSAEVVAQRAVECAACVPLDFVRVDRVATQAARVCDPHSQLRARQ